MPGGLVVVAAVVVVGVGVAIPYGAWIMKGAVEGVIREAGV